MVAEWLAGGEVRFNGIEEVERDCVGELDSVERTGLQCDSGWSHRLGAYSAGLVGEALLIWSSIANAIVYLCIN